MKKKISIIRAIAVFATIVIGLTGCGKKYDSVNSIITLDINPSIELEIKKGNIVKANAINEDANEYIKGLEGKSLEDSFDIIVKRVGENNLLDNGNITIILGDENNNTIIEKALKEVCDKNGVSADIIVPQITEEAKEEAKVHGITAAKAAYIKEVVTKIKVVNFEDLLNKSATELNEMKQTGKYCDTGYTLAGNFCEKAIREEKPIQSKVCPEGYEEVENKCYLKSDSIEEPYCKSGFELKNGKCVGIEKVDAKASCETGTYNSKTGKCEVLTYINAGTKSCKSADDLLLDNGRCAYPHMGAHFDDPEGEIDPATECCCGDTWVPNDNIPGRGWCYSMPNGNYDATIKCTNGTYYEKGDKGAGCYKAETTDAKFSCSKGTLEGNMCLVEASKNPEHKISCNKDSKLYQDRVCLNYNNTIDYIIGNKCENEARLIGEKCIYYDVVEAKISN